ncbi:glycoside hydrolase family 16 protein [Streptomyces sp. NPDC001348]
MRILAAVIQLGAAVPAFAGCSAPALHARAVAAKAPETDWGRPYFTDGFSGTSLNSADWNIYDDTGPVRPSKPQRIRSATRVSHGMLEFVGHVDPVHGDVSGGVQSRKFLTYGRWEVRMRADVGNGYDPVSLLWPKGKWPDKGEIDMVEIPNGKRNTEIEFLHYGSDNHQKGIHLKVDFTKWHTVAVDWLPDRITYYVDGKATWTVKRQRDPKKNLVPGTPFALSLQNDEGCSGYCRRDATTPKNVLMYVDWVKVYKVPARVLAKCRDTLVAPKSPPSTTFPVSASVYCPVAAGNKVVLVSDIKNADGHGHREYYLSKQPVSTENPDPQTWRVTATAGVTRTYYLISVSPALLKRIQDPSNTFADGGHHSLLGAPVVSNQQVNKTPS